MEEFTAEQISRAANRVREMQRRSVLPQNTQSVTKRQAPPSSEQKFIEQNSDLKEKKQSESPFGRILKLIDLKNFSFDDDSKLILGILLLLSSAQADELLILALVYVML